MSCLGDDFYLGATAVHWASQSPVVFPGEVPPVSTDEVPVAASRGAP